jgi:two-component system CheB/CheR fusion protein
MPNTPLRVLVVDDLADTVQSTAMLLRGWGHEVLTASNGEEAITLARRFAPDVVLCDLVMPEVSGWDVVRRVKAMAGLERTYLIAVTAYGSDRDRVSAAEAGFDLHLLKPVDPDHLRELLIQRVR